jgi:hypothetical protein
VRSSYGNAHRRRNLHGHHLSGFFLPLKRGKKLIRLVDVDFVFHTLRVSRITNIMFRFTFSYVTMVTSSPREPTFKKRSAAEIDNQVVNMKEHNQKQIAVAASFSFFYFGA